MLDLEGDSTDGWWMHEGWMARGAHVSSYTVRESEAQRIWKKFQMTIYEIWMFSQNSRIINGHLALLGFLIFFFFEKKQRKTMFDSGVWKCGSNYFLKYFSLRNTSK